jgi:hypothetical protein
MYVVSHLRKTSNLVHIGKQCFNYFEVVTSFMNAKRYKDQIIIYLTYVSDIVCHLRLYIVHLSVCRNELTNINVTMH